MKLEITRALFAAAVWSASSLVGSADSIVSEHIISTDTTWNTPLAATGDGFVANTPNSGAAHRNAVVVDNGATLTLASGAALTVDNDNNLTTFLRAGYYGAAGTMDILSGSTLEVGQSTRYANFHVGEGSGATGAVNQSGGAVTTMGSFNVGVDGGTGVYTMTGGTFTLTNADDAGHTSLAVLGLNLNAAGPSAGTSSGTLNLSGGTFTVTANKYDGTNYGSVSLILGNRDRGVSSYGDGDGVINQTGGVLHVDPQAHLYLSSVGNGVYNLTGGALEIGGNALGAKYGAGAGTYAFNFGGNDVNRVGATLRVIGSNLATSVNFTLNDATSLGNAAFDNVTATVDTNGFNAAFSGNVTGAGLHQVDFGGSRFVKTGAGTLTLSGTNGFDSAFVAGGTLAVTAGSTSAVEFAVGSGTGATGAFTISGGTLTINPSTRADNTTAVAGSFRVGDYGGAGTFTQTGGTVNVTTNSSLNIGNQGGSGTYDLQGGNLNLNDGLHVIGRSASGKAASNGALNISGGFLTVTGGGSLINGNNFTGTGVNYGTSTITQTGGTLHVDAGSILTVAGFGAGTYNLTGGVLEIGGANSFRARYNNATATSAFNLGGGTVRASGSAFVSDVAPVLTAATTSTIDTNGLGGTFSNGVSGTGDLVVTGGGALSLGVGASSSGNLRLVSGAITAGSIAATSYTLESGSITAALSGGVLTKNTSGTVELSGANTYASTVVNAGTLRLLSAASLSSGDVSLNGGTLDLNGFDRTVASVAFNGGVVSGGTLTSLAGLGTSGAADNTISGNLAGSGAFTQSGTGTTTLSGDNSGYSGAVAVNAGTLAAAGATSLGAGAVTIASSGTLSVGTTSATLGNTISGSGSLVVAGSGTTVTVTGNMNGFTGTTQVGAGTTFVVGTHANPVELGGSVQIAAGATLAGSSTFDGAVVISGQHHPGNSPGVDVFNAGVTYASGAVLVMEFATPAGGVAVAGTDYDHITVNAGGLVIASGAKLLLQAYGTVDYGATFWATDHAFELIDAPGFTGTFDVDTAQANSDAAGLGSWLVEQDALTGTVTAKWTATAVPEPSTYGLAGAGALLAAIAVRRRKRS